MRAIELSPQAEQRFCDAVLLWLAALIGLSLLPVSGETVRNLHSALITGGPCALVIWMVRYAEPGDLTLPSRIRTAAFTALGLAVTAVLALVYVHGVGNAVYQAGLPSVIGMAAAVTALIPALGLRAVRMLVAALLGALVALGAGLLIGERDALTLFCQFAFSGAAFGAAGASAIRRARELGRHTDSSTGEPCS